MVFLGYDKNKDSSYPVKMTCETDEELNSAITYLEEEIGVQNDQTVFNYGKNKMEVVGGVHIEDLLEECLKIKNREDRIKRNIYSSLSEDERDGSGRWFRFHSR